MGDNTDFMVRGTASAPGIRFVFADTRQTVTAGIAAHDTDPAAAALFGQALTVAALMGALLKDGEKYTLRWEYRGVLRSLLADVTTEGHIRGIPRPAHLMGDTTPPSRELFGDGGTITVIRSREGRIISSGSTRAALLDITEDIAYFLSVSDQVESGMVVTLKFNPSPEDPVHSASGFLLQAMPECDLERFDSARTALRSHRFQEALADTGRAWEPKLHHLLDLALAPPEQGGSLLTGLGLHYELGAPPSYTCSCSPERMRNALAMMKREELEEILHEEGGRAEVVCQFCSRRYSFGSEDVRTLRGD